MLCSRDTAPPLMEFVLQAHSLGQGKCESVSGMDGEVCLASHCKRVAPVFNGPAVAHVVSAEYGISVHSSSLHRTMSLSASTCSVHRSVQQPRFLMAPVMYIASQPMWHAD